MKLQSFDDNDTKGQKRWRQTVTCRSKMCCATVSSCGFYCLSVCNVVVFSSGRQDCGQTLRGLLTMDEVRGLELNKNPAAAACKPQPTWLHNSRTARWKRGSEGTNVQVDMDACVEQHKLLTTVRKEDESPGSTWFMFTYNVCVVCQWPPQIWKYVHNCLLYHTETSEV